MKFFISYCDNDGLQFASNAASVLEANGHKAWYFNRNKTPGIQLIDDITQQIRHWCNKILYICTDGSFSSGGQRREIGQWYMTDKQLIVIPINSAIVPDQIDPYIYHRMSSHGFVAELNTFIKDRLKEYVKNYEEYNLKIKIQST